MLRGALALHPVGPLWGDVRWGRQGQHEFTLTDMALTWELDLVELGARPAFRLAGENRLTETDRLPIWASGSTLPPNSPSCTGASAAGSAEQPVMKGSGTND